MEKERGITITTKQGNEDLAAVSSSAVCKHTWDKVTGKLEQGRPHIGIKGRWIRTCTTCGAKESFSKGMFNGWYSAK